MLDIHALRRFTTQAVALALLCVLVNFRLPAQPAGVERTATGTHGMVSTAHPLAAEAGLEMLKKGGNAVDAAVAAAFAIGVVEPDGSGLGGGGGMLIYLHKEERMIYINFYQRAGAHAEQLDYVSARDRQTAKAALVPGNVAGLTLALEKYGTLPLSTVMQPAIRLAARGFPIDRTLAGIILDNVSLLSTCEHTSSIYLPDGFPLAEGDTLRQPDLATTLQHVAQAGRDGFYEGRVATEIVNAVEAHGGNLTLDDFRSYRPDVLEPVHGSYRGFDVYSSSPPQSGVTLLEALNVLECTDLRTLGHFQDSAKALHLMAETMRRVYADRTAYLADPKFEEVPLEGLESKAFARTRYDDINPGMATPSRYRDTKPGNPIPFNHSESLLEQLAPDAGWPGGESVSVTGSLSTDFQEPASVDAAGGHTTHLSVVDADRNAVSLTQTLGTFFGSGLTAAGVLLNNARSNFSQTAKRNSIQGGKQPRSSISPTIVLKDGNVRIVLGSPGAARIVATVTQLLVNIIDYGMDAEQANDAPRFFCQKFDDHLYVESRISESVRNELEAMGHSVQVNGDYDLFFGGAQIVLVDPTTAVCQGSADPRRGGASLGY